MHRFQLFIVLFLFVTRSFGQASYSGTIDKYPIDLAMDVFPDGLGDAVYVYTNINDPIQLRGKLANQKLILYEKDVKKRNTATFTFLNYTGKDKTIEGVWKNLLTGKELKVNLSKNFAMDEIDNDEWKDKELIQPGALKNEYFKLLLSKGSGDAYPRVTGIKILEKKSDRMIQRLDVDCEFRGFNTLSLGDFNFDGFTDIAVFESSYAGPNTSSIYFLYDPKSKQFFDSGFTGVSLLFDAKTKRVTEHNQCCAGSKHTTAIYKIVNNKMVLTEQHCFVWDEKKNKLVERKLKNCE